MSDFDQVGSPDCVCVCNVQCRIMESQADSSMPDAPNVHHCQG